MNYKEFKNLIHKWSYDLAPMSFDKHKHENKDIIINFANKNLENKNLIISYALLRLGLNIHEALVILHELIDDKSKPTIYEEFQGRMRALEEIYTIWGDDNNYIKMGYSPKAYWMESCFDKDAKELEEKYRYWNDEDMNAFKNSPLDLKDFKENKYKTIFDK